MNSAKPAAGRVSAGRAVASAQSLATLERRLRFAEVLLGISQKVSGVDSLDEVLEALVLVTAQEL